MNATEGKHKKVNNTGQSVFQLTKNVKKQSNFTIIAMPWCCSIILTVLSDWFTTRSAV